MLYLSPGTNVKIFKLAKTNKLKPQLTVECMFVPKHPQRHPHSHKSVKRIAQRGPTLASGHLWDNLHELARSKE